MDWYFAYGSNMNPARMQARGVPFLQMQAGQLLGYTLRFNKRAAGKSGVAYANVQVAPGCRVEGVLYQVPMQTLVLLDTFEGTPIRYSRERFWIDTAAGRQAAWVYIANRAWLAEGLLPEARYLDHLLAGQGWLSAEYRDFLQAQPCHPSTAISSNDESLALQYNL